MYVSIAPCEKPVTIGLPRETRTLRKWMSTCASWSARRRSVSAITSARFSVTLKGNHVKPLPSGLGARGNKSRIGVGAPPNFLAELSA